jgi:hypothetical protein
MTDTSKQASLVSCVQIICLADPACCSQVDTLASATINGIISTPSCNGNKWAAGTSYGSLAFTGLTSLFPSVPEEGLLICLSLQPGSRCGSVQDLCFGNSCIYSLAAANNMQCCMVDHAPEVGLIDDSGDTSGAAADSSGAISISRNRGPVKKAKPPKPTKPTKTKNPTRPRN